MVFERLNHGIGEVARAPVYSIDTSLPFMATVGNRVHQGRKLLANASCVDRKDDKNFVFDHSGTYHIVVDGRHFMDSRLPITIVKWNGDNTLYIIQRGLTRFFYKGHTELVSTDVNIIGWDENAWAVKKKGGPWELYECGKVVASADLDILWWGIGRWALKNKVGVWEFYHEKVLIDECQMIASDIDMETYAYVNLNGKLIQHQCPMFTDIIECKTAGYYAMTYNEEAWMWFDRRGIAHLVFYDEEIFVGKEIKYFGGTHFEGLTETGWKKL